MAKKNPFYFKQNGRTTHNRKVHLLDSGRPVPFNGESEVWAIVGENASRSAACGTQAVGVVLTREEKHVTCLRCLEYV